MGIDIWEVIDAAKTKPFGYMPFYPGPGLGGHCIPIDPFYLTWESRKYELSTRFIELAGEINVAMPLYVVDRLARALDEREHKALSLANILIVGLAYKKNVRDTRESPSLRIMELLRQRGTTVAFHDPHAAEVPKTREYPQFAGLKSTALDARHIADFDAVLIATDHDAIDYRLLAEHAQLIIDTRNAMQRRGIVSTKIIKS
jgi:UDP-N-acetyl-D-glucosamine dehydrogenase